jgi:chemotaxis protein methyltransferase CheR
MNNEDIEIKCLLEALFEKSGHDFRHYSQAHLKRRLKHLQSAYDVTDLSQMIHRLLYDASFLEILLHQLSINVTEMFRDPSFYAAVREKVVPILATWPHVKVWHAGCASGEEVYSMAILLHEACLYRKCKLYGTDFSPRVLDDARKGVYPVERVKAYTENYLKAGGKESFSDYYNANYNYVLMEKFLKENLIFAEHNLAVDTVFSEVNMVVCRNVMIYFNRTLQNRVLKLFWESLCPGGILCLGNKEAISPDCRELFEVIDEKERIYRRKYG